jgi:hypothetical protein
MPIDLERLNRVERDFNEMKLFHRDVVNELKGQGEVLVELKDYIKELADFKNDMGANLSLLSQSYNSYIVQNRDTIKRIFDTIEIKEASMEKRLTSLESDRKWLVRLIMSTIVAALLYSIGLTH